MPETQIADENKAEENPREAKAVEKKPASSSQNNDNDRVEKIIDVLRGQPDITQRALAKETKISQPKVNTILQQLRAEGKIIREGTSRKGSWIVAGEKSKNICYHSLWYTYLPGLLIHRRSDQG